MKDCTTIMDALNIIEQNLVVKNKAICLLKKFVSFNERCWEMIKSLENDDNAELAEMYLQEIDNFYQDAKDEWEDK